MRYRQGRHGGGTSPEREFPLHGDRLRLEISGVPILSVEGKVKALCQVIETILRGMHRQRGVRAQCKPPQVVKAHDVIGVLVSKQGRIQLANVFPQALAAKIRPGVDHPFRLRSLDKNRRPQALVARIIGLAHGTVTPDHRHTDRCPGAKKGKLKIGSWRFEHSQYEQC